MYVPVANGLIWTVKLKVTLALAGRSTVVARAPMPLVSPETLPPPLLPANAQLAAMVPAGSGSETLAPVTVFRPVVADRDRVGVGRARHHRRVAVGLGDRQVSRHVNLLPLASSAARLLLLTFAKVAIAITAKISAQAWFGVR
jgi:hypothetical protein